MTVTTIRQNVFSAGELSPLMEARPEFERVRAGTRAMRGFLPLRQGPFTRAPGTIFRGYTDGNAAGRLIPFEFAEDDAVVLEFTPLKMRVWRYGALVDDGGSPFELVTPYDAAAIARLVWVQSADVVYFCDGVNPIQKLSRLALDDWTIEAAEFANGPFRVQNVDEALTLQADAETGTVTLTASSSFFEADHVGGLIRLSAVDYTDVADWVGNQAVSVGAYRRYDGRTYEVTAGTNTGANPPIHLEGERLTDASTGITWKYLEDGSGIVKVTSITSATEAEAEVVKRLPRGVVTDPTYRFAEGAWSERFGYPAAIAIYDQRLVAAATASDPRTLWFSTGGAFEDFEPSLEADGSFAYAIGGTASRNRILWLLAGEDALYIGALGGVYASTRIDPNAIVGPANIEFEPKGQTGAAFAQPIAPQGRPIFISKDKARLFDLVYSLERDATSPREISLPSEHLGAAVFEEIVWQSAPLGTAWIRCQNGELVAMVNEPQEQVLGFAPYPVAGGVVESVAVSPAADAETDVVTMIVRREIDGQTVRMIEEQAEIFGSAAGERPIAEAHHLFAAAVFVEDPATDTFAVPHLVGRQVEAWTDAGRFGPYTVPESGDITLGAPVTRAIVGLFDDTHKVRTVPFDPPARDGATLGRSHKLHAGGGIRLHRTAGAAIRAVERARGVEIEHPAQQLIDPGVAQPLDDAFSGVAIAEIAAGYADEVMLEYLPVGGAPMTVLAHAVPVEEGGL